MTTNVLRPTGPPSQPIVLANDPDLRISGQPVHACGDRLQIDWRVWIAPSSDLIDRPGDAIAQQVWDATARVVAPVMRAIPTSDSRDESGCRALTMQIFYRRTPEAVARARDWDLR